MGIRAKSDTLPRPAPAIRVAAIPAELKALDQWVAWRYRTRDGKATKVPYQAASPSAEARSDDPATWSTFERAMATATDPANRVDGIGFVFSADDPYAGLDLDRCLDEAGQLQHWALDILARVPGYAELSPSGRGIKLFARASVPGGRGRKRMGLEPEMAGAVEAYDRGRFFTVTGHAYGTAHREIVEAGAELLAVHAEVFPPKPDRVRVDPAPASMGDSELVARAMAAKNGDKLRDLWSGNWQPHFGSPSEADLSLCSLLAFWTQDPAAIDRLFRQSGMVDTKWTDRPDYRDLTIGKALERATIHDPARNGSGEKNHSKNPKNCKNSGDGPAETASGGAFCNNRYSWNGSRELLAAPSGEWPDPRLGGPEPAEPFPLEALPPPLAGLVAAAAESLGCPVDFPALAALGVASGAMGRSVVLKVKDGWVEAPALYAALVGDPGMTKSPAVGLMARPLWSITRQELEAHRREVARARREKADPPDAGARRVVVDDATVEAMAGLLGDNPRGLVMVRDELSALFAGLNQYKTGGKGADRQFYLSAWSGSSVSVDRKHAADRAPVHVPHPFLSIVGGMTPGMLSEMGESKGRDDGFLDRILFACPEPVKVRWVDRGVPDDLVRDWEDAVRRLWSAPMAADMEGKPRPRFVRLTPEASAGYAAWYDAHNEEAEAEDFPAHLRGPWAKMRAYCARLALALDRMARAFDPEGPGEPADVGLDSLFRAIVLMAYFKSHTRRVRSLMRGGFGDCPEARKILRWARGTNRDRFAAADVRHNFRKLFPVDGGELEAALRWLETRHCIRPAAAPAEKGKGRPHSPVYEVNPALMGDIREE